MNILNGVLATVLVMVSTYSMAETEVANARNNAAIPTEPTPPPMAREINDDKRRVRDYPMAAPVIPHKIDGYQIDLNANKCLSCHNRQRVGESQAVMVSVTHFMNRDGNFLADVSPNRYFCTQCHASQLDVDLLIDNHFVPMNESQSAGGQH